MSDPRRVPLGGGSTRGRIYTVRVDVDAAPAGARRQKPTRLRRRRRPAPLSRLLLAIATCVMAAMVVALSVQYARTFALAQEAARLERHRRDLVAQNARLRQEIHRLQTDDAYIEEIARRQLGLVRPGEIELLIVSPGSTSSSGSLPRAAGAAGAGPDRGEGTGPDLVPQDAPPHGDSGTGGAPDDLRTLVVRLWSRLARLAGWLRW